MNWDIITIAGCLLGLAAIIWAIALLYTTLLGMTCAALLSIVI